MGTDAKHVVRLTVAERVQLEGIVSDSRAAKGRVLRSRMLFKADADGLAWPDSQIAEAFTTANARVKLKRLYPITEPIKIKMVDH